VLVFTQATAACRQVTAVNFCGAAIWACGVGSGSAVVRLVRGMARFGHSDCVGKRLDAFSDDLLTLGS